MYEQSVWTQVTPIANVLTGANATNRQLALESFIGMSLPKVASGVWNKSALSARIAYEMGETETAQKIAENTIEKINSWLPTELKVFALLLYKARLAFYTSQLEVAEACYQWAYEMMNEYHMTHSLGSIAAELYDEWGECLVLLGYSDEAMERYQLAVAIDLQCHEEDPRQMSAWRLVKLADYYSVKGETKLSNLCLAMANARAESPVEKQYIQNYKRSK